MSILKSKLSRKRSKKNINASNRFKVEIFNKETGEITNAITNNSITDEDITDEDITDEDITDEDITDEDILETGENDETIKINIIDQLQRRINKISIKHSNNKTERSSSLQNFSSKITANQTKPANIYSNTNSTFGTAMLPGEICDTSMGEVWVNRKVYKSNYCHGTKPISKYLSSGNGLSALGRDKRFASLNPQGALFLDTETTGLSGGTGTLPFLIGIAWFKDDGEFVVEHLFCRQPSEESAQLEMLSKRMATAKYLVTFNGRSFDMPLVNTRYIMNKMKNPGASLPHLDLLHIARRVFGRRLNDRSLGNLENEILGFYRHNDIPGSEIPGVYAQYLQDGLTNNIVSILDHNSHDLVALAALGGMLDQMYKDPAKVEHYADHLGLAKSAYFVGERSTADAHLLIAKENATNDDKREAFLLEAKDAKKQKKFANAKNCWIKAIELNNDDSYAHFELAKHYEHKEKNFKKALDHANSAKEIEGDEASEHRIARIKRKINRKIKRTFN